MKALPQSAFWVHAVVVGLFATTAVIADSVTLTSSGDATISEYSPGSQLGEDAYIESGSSGPEQLALRNRALLKFDLAASLPSNAIVTSAALTLTLFKAPRTDVLLFSLHKVLQDWSEESVTWTNRLSPPEPWNVPGCAAPLDYASSVTQSNLIDPLSVPRTLTLLPQMGDRFQFQFNAEPNRNYTAEYCSELIPANWMVLTNITPLPEPADVIVSDARLTDSNRFYRVRTPPNYTFNSNPAMVANVQDWVSNSASNFGWIIICNQEDLERSKRRFYSNQVITKNRPALTVEFSLPPP